LRDHAANQRAQRWREISVYQL